MENFQQSLTALAVNGTFITKLTALTAQCTEKISLPFLAFFLTFLTVHFFQKRLIRFVDDLKINGFCRSLTDSSVNFRKPPFR